jgi:hypothetical protein
MTQRRTRANLMRADCKRIVAVMPAEGWESQHHVVFLENFFDELRRLAPVKR